MHTSVIDLLSTTRPWICFLNSSGGGHLDAASFLNDVGGRRAGCGVGSVVTLVGEAGEGQGRHRRGCKGGARSHSRLRGLLCA